MANYDGKFGIQDPADDKDAVFENLFVQSNTPDINDTDEVLETPMLQINLEEIDRNTQNRAEQIVARLSDYFFDAKYIKEHPYIPNKIVQEVDNIRRLFKMLTINEKAQDTLILSITLSASKGTLYGSLTSLQNSMLSMQTQLNQMINNLENIFREMQEQCERTFEEKDKETNEDGSFAVRGSREFIKAINARLTGKASAEDMERAARKIVDEATKEVETKYEDDYDAEIEIEKILG